jgi:CBS domain-containing protein
MTPFPYSVDVEAPIDQALQFMREHKIKHLPVIEKGALKSLVSDRDIKLVLGPDGAVPPDRNLIVRDAMVENCYLVDLATPLHVVVRHMAEQRLGSALVTRRGKLAGIFTATDACRVLADHLEGAATIDEENDAA